MGILHVVAFRVHFPIGKHVEQPGILSGRDKQPVLEVHTNALAQDAVDLHLHTRNAVQGDLALFGNAIGRDQAVPPSKRVLWRPRPCARPSRRNGIFAIGCRS